jgi:DNA-binding LytR/AlgR family response regulator
MTFGADDDKQTLRILNSQFIYAESADNYTDIVYIENGIVKRELIDQPLRTLEEKNASDFTLRIHPFYFVNLFKVIKVTGNAQGLRLSFEDPDQSVPVAKRMLPRLKELLKSIHPDVKTNQDLIN